MIGRVVTIAVLMCAVAVGGQPHARQTLYIFHAESCGPCRQLDRALRTDAAFKQALESRFCIHSIDMQTQRPSERKLIARLKITAVPAFVVLANGQEVTRVVGFWPGKKRELVAALSVRANPAVNGPQRTQPPQPKQPKQRPRQVEPEQSSEIQRLLDSIDHLSRRLDDAEGERERLLDQAEDDRHQALQNQNQKHAAELKALRQQLRNAASAHSHESSKAEDAEQLDSIFGSSETLRDSPAADAPEQTAQPPPTNDSTASESGRSTLGWIARVGLMVAAPEVAILGSAALTVAGFFLGRWRERRRRRNGSRWSDPPISHDRTTVVRLPEQERTTTENHYIVKETDDVGEAYKEALRRMTATYKSDKPGIVDVVQQIDHIAGEIIRGRRVTDRPNKQPRPGIWDDQKVTI